jgi:hypothetical protein
VTGAINEGAHDKKDEPRQHFVGVLKAANWATELDQQKLS